MYKKTSLLDGFELPNITHENIKQQLIKLGNSHLVRQRKSIDGLPIEERLKVISDEVMKILSRYKDFVRVIYDENELNQYIDFVISRGDEGILAFDTETNNSIDPLTCKLMGLCLYIPNTKPVYVPINHCYPETDTLLPNQVSMQCVTDICNKIKNSAIKLIYHNGKFDIRVCYNTAGVYLPIWWDTMIAAQLINENEQAKLKVQYKAHVDSTMSEYNIENLFTGLPYAWISPELFAYYAAIDSYDTYSLQQKQQRYFEEVGNEKLYNLFMNIEMPIVTVTAEMEDNGICIDTDYTDRLNKKYQSIAAKYRKDIDEILEPYKDKISYYQSIGKIDNPVNYDSAAQLTIILYDILETPVGVDGKKATDKATLKSIKTPFTETILKYRHYNKLITSFTEPLPKLISKRDGKLHAHFNQMGKEERGVRTGRFSSTDPNLQQIPSHEASMRLMFSASPNHAIVGGDFSQQEPRLLTHICKDKNLIDTYIAGKDLYATIGSKIFKKDYWECMEHWEDGSPNPTGKDIRKMCKQIVLATMYGMGAKLLASMINVDIEKCREILDEFYKMFPSVKEFAQSNELKAKNIGYVEDYMGRRRHLPDASLPEISVDAKRDIITDCSKIFVDCIPADDKIEISDKELTYKWQSIYNNDYRDNGFNAKVKFKELAKKSNIGIADNGAFISKATTQCVNASIQGSAATLTKKAMVLIHNDKELKNLGFKLLIPVHDELLGECPIENAEKCSKLLSQLMVDAAKPECNVPMKVDTYVVKHWYADELNDIIQESYHKMIDKGNTHEQAVLMLERDYPELRAGIVDDICKGNFNVMTGDV